MDKTLHGRAVAVLNAAGAHVAATYHSTPPPAASGQLLAVDGGLMMVGA